ncbi:MAG: leucine-rich repeat domain-containing protein [Prevotellaceae bacterium]|jgi:internalin A|nr:leucine-rich repeat domain-containing protein [Prevotellaceae bacterium]
MDKLKEILELEKIYGIRLKESVPDEYGCIGPNCYAVDTKGTVIHLNLSENRLSKIYGLEIFVNLQELDFFDNQLKEIKGLENLVNLRQLHLGGNQLTEIKGLESLVNLQLLNIFNNHLTEIKGLENLDSLQELYLSKNHLVEIKGLEELTKLQKLRLSENHLTEIKGLEKLVSLQELDLSQNQLMEIKGLESLVNLRVLKLHTNQLTEIKGLKNLISLQELDLSSNRLTKIKRLENLDSLRQLELDYNRLSEISGLASIIGQLNFLRIDSNPFLKNSELLLYERNHHDIILKYLSDIKQKKVKITLPAKVMLLGNHASGKTTFRYYMQKGNIIEPKSTHILKIVPYPEKWTGLPEAIIFDFGGQDYYHGLYQAFFSEDPIYMLFWCNESNINDVRKANDGTNAYIRNFTKGYWMHQLKYIYTKWNKERKEMGRKEYLFSTPLLLIQTHADKKGTMSRAEYQEEDFLRSINIVDESYISLDMDTENDQLFELRRQCVKISLLREIEKKRQPRKKGVYYERFLQYILDWDKKDYVKLDEVLEEYDREESNKENKRAILKVELEILSRKGLVLYYKKNKLLNDVVWLNPAKTVKDIHDNVLSKEKVKIEYEGIVPEDAFNGLCGDEKIRELLICEKVIFFDEKNKEGARYIVPGYLPLSHKEDEDYTHNSDFIKPNFTLKFRYFIPFGLINQLICLYGDNLYGKKFWRDQLRFTYNGEYRLCIKLDFSQLTIAVHIHPILENPSKELAIKEVEKTIFRNIIDLYWGKEVNYQINRDRVNPAIPEKESFAKQVQAYLAHWDSKEDIPDDMYISVDEILFVRAIDLEKVVKNQTTISAYGLVETGEKTANGEKIKILEFKSEQVPQQIDLYKNFTNNENMNYMKKFFISFSTKDREYKNEFIEHTKTMQRKGTIDKPFECDDIELGAKWDERIKKELNDCDTVICLASSSFLNSNYITMVEVKEALKQKKRLIPVIVRPCDWKNSELGEFQAALQGKCISIELGSSKENTKVERDALWLEVIEQMRENL